MDLTLTRNYKSFDHATFKIEEYTKTQRLEWLEVIDIIRLLRCIVNSFY